MKKFLFFTLVLFCVAFKANAQQYALIDMEYITKQIPAYQIGRASCRERV